MGQQGRSNIVTFENRTDGEVAFSLVSPNDSTSTICFSIPANGFHYYPVPGLDARSYERLRLVDARDGSTTNVSITTDDLCHLGGWTLVVTRDGAKFPDLVREDTRRKPWQFFTAPFRYVSRHSSRRDRLPR